MFDLKNITGWLLILASLAGYIFIGYFTPRAEFLQLAGIYGGLFILYLLLVNSFKGSFSFLIGFSVLFRIALLFSIPNLSDDYARFIWDGKLFTNGINPFLHLPSELLDSGLPFAGEELYQKLNSPDYYTVYPPINQFIFSLSARLFPSELIGQIAVMKSFIVLAEIGTILYMQKLLSRFNLSRNHVLLYALNPLIIIELTGNLHFEGIMIFFLLLSTWLLARNQLWKSSVVFGAAVCTKFLPLIFLPFLIKRLGWLKSLWFSFIAAGVTGLLFLPFADPLFVDHLLSSINLYFQSFEFNASIYYIVREAGYFIKGYNIIETAGIVLPVLVFLSVTGLALMERNPDWKSFPVMMLFSLSLYFALASIVHPWYISTLVALSCFTTFRYAIIWSGLVILSYSAYQTTDYTENWLLIATEYIAVFLWIGYEFRLKVKEMALSRAKLT